MEMVTLIFLDKGLLAWYPFENNALDMSGNNRHGELFPDHRHFLMLFRKISFFGWMDDYMDIVCHHLLIPEEKSLFPCKL